jgi:hypothetical protein
MEVPNISITEHGAIVENPGGVGFRIQTLWAFISTQPGDESDEGIVAMHVNGSWLPLIGADLERLHELMPIAAEMATNSDEAPIKLVRFERVSEEVIVVVPPDGAEHG